MPAVTRFSAMSAPPKGTRKTPGSSRWKRSRCPPTACCCSAPTGLTDLIGSAEVRAGVERYAPDFDAAIRALIDAANAAGGKDNITIVIVAGPAYGVSPARAREKNARVRIRVSLSWVFLLCGLVLGAAGGFFVPHLWSGFAVPGPQTFTVGPGGIAAAMNQAQSGDTVLIPQGRYRERIVLRQGVLVRAQVPGAVTVTSPDGGPAVVANKIDAGGIEGVWIQGGIEAPLSTGIDIQDASPLISNMKVTDAKIGIEVSGASSPAITSNEITNNLAAGIVVRGQAFSAHRRQSDRGERQWQTRRRGTRRRGAG